MIDEESLNQAVLEYATKKYGDRAKDLQKRYGMEFPEKDWDIPDDAWHKNYLCWLLFEKVMPESGKTIAEEFAEVSEDLDPKLRSSISQMKNMIRSDFIVISKKDTFAKFKDMRTNMVYNVKLRRETSGTISPNMIITGRIHPFDDHYRVTGIFLTKVTPLILDPSILMNAFENDMLADMENMRLKRDSTFRSVMNRYPSHWIDWMSKHYGIKERLKKDKICAIEVKLTTEAKDIVEGLSEGSRAAMRACMKHGGFVKYGLLRDFDDDLGFFWDEGPCRSPLGVLRQKALLFVGKMGFGDRSYKVAFVPVELRDGVRAALRPEGGSGIV